MNHAFKIKNSAATTKAKASVSTVIQEHGFQFGSKRLKMNFLFRHVYESAKNV